MATGSPVPGIRHLSGLRPGAEITRRASPNFGARRGGVLPDMVVVHFTAMATVEAALARLCDPVHEVSAHYLICPAGHITQMVDESARAWHAGAGAWGATGDVNSRSIGIELANDGATPFAHLQMRALDGLLAGIMARWQIMPERVIGHSDMAPGRKIDPGPRFDWAGLAWQGLSVWPDVVLPAPAPLDAAGQARLARALAEFGYPDGDAAVLLGAFRLRFRPRHDGPADARDLAIAENLAARFPVDRAPASP